MSVVVIGVNQRSIPIGDFEKLAIDEASLGKVLDDVTSSDDISEAVILSTCNRTEIYIRCLLYTSPSPRDRTRSRMPSSA